MPKISEYKKLDRPAIIYALARHAHPSWYHSLLAWPTEALRALLVYYETEDKTRPASTPVFCVVGVIKN